MGHGMISLISPRKMSASSTTHPTVGVAELMRILLDEEHVLEDAWAIVQKPSPTPGTLLPEAGTLAYCDVPTFTATPAGNHL